MGGSESNCPPCNCPECPACDCPEQNCPPRNCPECPVYEPVKEAIIYKDDIVKNDYNNLIKNISKLIAASFDSINNGSSGTHLTQSPETYTEENKEKLRKSGKLAVNSMTLVMPENKLFIIGSDVKNKNVIVTTCNTKYDDNDNTHHTELKISTPNGINSTNEYELMKYPITKITYPSKDDLTENEKFITNKYESNSKFNFYPLIIIIIIYVVIFLFISKINRNNIDNYNCINPSNYKFNNMYF